VSNLLLLIIGIILLLLSHSLEMDTNRRLSEKLVVGEATRHGGPGSLLVLAMSIKDHSLLAILDMLNSAKHIFGIMTKKANIPFLP
jgi:hypothetical protein